MEYNIFPPQRRMLLIDDDVATPYYLPFPYLVFVYSEGVFYNKREQLLMLAFANEKITLNTPVYFPLLPNIFLNIPHICQDCRPNINSAIDLFWQSEFYCDTCLDFGYRCLKFRTGLFGNYRNWERQPLETITGVHWPLFPNANIKSLKDLLEIYQPYENRC